MTIREEIEAKAKYFGDDVLQEENIVRLTTIEEINAASDPVYYRLLKFYILASMFMFIFSLLTGEFLLTAGFIIIMILAASVVKY